MNSIKIAFFDIDGTLIDMDKKAITDKMLETLIQLKQNNIKICIATGRPPQNIPCFPDVEFDALLAFNGSYCYTKNEIIFKNPIPPSDVQKIIKNAEAMNRPVTIANAVRLGSNGRDRDLIDYFAISNQPVEITEDFEDLSKGDIYQIMMGCYREEYERALDQVTGARITAWWHRAVDIIPADGGKGLGVEKVLSYYHLTREDAVAFGDGTNDIDMLKAAGLGIAMGNATADVKQIADGICGSVAEDGIYYYCKENHLI